MDTTVLSPGRRLRAARLNAGLATRELAEQIGVNRNTIVRAERGEGVYPATAKKIADYFGVQVTDLWPVEERAA